MEIRPMNEDQQKPNYIKLIEEIENLETEIDILNKLIREYEGGEDKPPELYSKETVERTLASVLTAAPDRIKQCSATVIKIGERLTDIV